MLGWATRSSPHRRLCQGHGKGGHATASSSDTDGTGSVSKGQCELLRW